MLRELAPLLAEEGINNTDELDMDTLQQALNRAVERRNLALFTPVGPSREVAAVTLRLVVEAIAESNPALAAAILDQVPPESPDNSTRYRGRLHRSRPRWSPVGSSDAPHMLPTSAKR